jgi:hypothetical protein
MLMDAKANRYENSQDRKGERRYSYVALHGAPGPMLSPRRSSSNVGVASCATHWKPSKPN